MDFDQAFERGDIGIDFSKGLRTKGMKSLTKLPPMEIPSWLVLEIESIAKIQGNTRASVIRQLLTEALELKVQRKVAS